MLSGVTDTVGKGVSGKHRKDARTIVIHADYCLGVTDTAGNVVGGNC